MPSLRRLTCLISLTLTIAACTSSQPPAEQPLFRPFTKADAHLLGVDKRTAAEVVKGGLTRVATRDFYTHPDCQGEVVFLLATKQARWLGGDPGCMVVRLTMPNQPAPMALNPFCHLPPELVTNCLQLDYTPPTVDEMMAQLRPAARAEVQMVLSPDPKEAEFRLPAALKQSWFVAQTNPSQQFWVAPLYGSEAINIIVPSDLKLAGGRLGHNQLYLGGPHLIRDPLCLAVKEHGLAQLPIQFSGAELTNLKFCEQQ